MEINASYPEGKLTYKGTSVPLSPSSADLEESKYGEWGGNSTNVFEFALFCTFTYLKFFHMPLSKHALKRSFFKVSRLQLPVEFRVSPMTPCKESIYKNEK